MVLQDPEKKAMPLEKIAAVLQKFEDQTSPDSLHKFKDTAIYTSFIHNYNLLSPVPYSADNPS